MNPRALAIEILARVEATDAYLNKVLEERLSSAAKHAPRDAAFTTELCYGTTRRRLTLDYALTPVLDRRLETIEDRVLAALRMGVYQAFYMRVPARAAVAETVEALKELRLSRATGFVNAVLRKIVALPALPLPSESAPVQHWAVKESHPAWLVERWINTYGQPQTEAMLAADNQPPALTLRANSTRSTRDALLAEMNELGLGVRATSVSPDGLVVESPGKLESLYGFSEGLWQVQDEAAQQVVQFADLPPDGRVWDVCAAPGGKTCQLAERHAVLSTDLYAHKLARLEQEAKRLGLRERIKVVLQDATQPLPESHGDFDAVLLDAPCSGLGTLRRHPELRYRREASDIPRLVALQAQLLEAVHTRVKPGGLMIYAVCSTEPEEGAQQIEKFLAQHSNFARDPSDRWLQTYPGSQGWDGFFAGRLRRSPF